MLGGHDLDRDPVKAKRLAAFIPDEPRLFDYLTVQEHLRIVGRLYGADGVDARASALLAELELSGRESSLPAALSRGMKQKLAIACGLIHDPRIILFDEPLTGLDPAAIPCDIAGCEPRGDLLACDR
jgi:ABC-2 type transport system ATP-binding protein